MGKTSLLMLLLNRLFSVMLPRRGLCVGAIKHAHHDFDIDYPGKDSYELRQAGAGQALIASQPRWALVVEGPEAAAEPTLDELLRHLDLTTLAIAHDGALDPPPPIPELPLNAPESIADFILERIVAASRRN